MAFQILIVDDSETMREFIVRVIQLSGFHVGGCHHAGNGQEALEVLRSKWVDIILTDVNMPVMNGEEFLARMAADEQLHAIPVLVVSTDGTRHRVEQMMSLGAKGYITKPFTPEMLRAAMEQLLGAAHD
jgi:two-component system, chemotaxis family, chemotaxis protein CheY